MHISPHKQLFTCSTVVFFSLCCAHAAYAAALPPTQLDAGNGYASAPAIATSYQGRQIAAWQALPTGRVNPSEVYASIKTNGAWSPPTLVSNPLNTGKIVSGPVVATNYLLPATYGPLTATVAWVQREGGRNNIFVNVYQAGLGWAGAKPLIVGSGSSTQTADNVDIAAVSLPSTSGAFAVTWRQRNAAVVGAPRSVWSSQYLNSVWSAPVVMENYTWDITGAPKIVRDFAGNFEGVYWNQFNNDTLPGTHYTSRGGASLGTAYLADSRMTDMKYHQAYVYGIDIPSQYTTKLQRYTSGFTGSWQTLGTFKAPTESRNVLASGRLAVAAEGSVHVMWSRYSSTLANYETVYNRYYGDSTAPHAISGWLTQAPQPLHTLSAKVMPTQFNLASEPNGNLHLSWSQVEPNGNHAVYTQTHLNLAPAAQDRWLTMRRIYDSTNPLFDQPQGAVEQPTLDKIRTSTIWSENGHIYLHRRTECDTTCVGIQAD